MKQDTPSRHSDQFPLRFPDGLREAIKSRAKANRRSMNAEIVAMLEHAMDAPVASPRPDPSHAMDPLFGTCAVVFPAPFSVGDQVEKYTGDYSAPGELRGIFAMKNGAVRYVVEHRAEGGGSFCHIYAAGNLRSLEPETSPCEPIPFTDDASEAHPDDLAADRFAAAMKAKLAEKRDEGRGGWEDKDDCSQLFLSQLLREHVEKGDPLDVGNFAMMLHQREERIASLLEALQGE